MKTLIAMVCDMKAKELDTWLAALRDQLPECDIVRFDQLSESQRGDVEIAIVANPDPAEIKQLPNLVWVQSLWAGVERLLAEIPNAEFKIIRMTDPQMALEMSEAVLAWTLYLHKNMPLLAKFQREKKWNPVAAKTATQTSVAVLGLGKLGRACALRLAQNGFVVSGWSRSLAQIEGVETFAGPEGLSYVLANNDIIVLLLPLTPQTRYLINDKTLGLMRPGTSIINFARGGIIQTDDLLASLDSGHLGHCVLDVFEVEPLPVDHRLWNHEQITVLPHISASTNVHTASVLAGENIRTILKTGEFSQTVDRGAGY